MALGLQWDRLSRAVATWPAVPVRPLWGLRYDAADRSSKLLVILDAQTGATLFAGN
jgi:hypothetical protein